MKKLILILIVVLNTSFIEIHKKYYQAIVWYHPYKGTEYVTADIIEAKDYLSAKKIMMRESKKGRVTKLMKIRDTWVSEIKKEDILK